MEEDSLTLDRLQLLHLTLALSVLMATLLHPKALTTEEDSRMLKHLQEIPILVHLTAEAQVDL